MTDYLPIRVDSGCYEPGVAGSRVAADPRLAKSTRRRVLLRGKWVGVGGKWRGGGRSCGERAVSAIVGVDWYWDCGV